MEGEAMSGDAGRPDFCCPMRAKYLLGIVAEDPALPTPTEAVDFIDWDARRDDGKLVAVIKFCPFCGRPVTGNVRTV